MNTIHSIKKVNGIAGQYGYVVKVQYEGEEPRTLQFISSVYGGGVIMVHGRVQSRVVNPDRFGAVLNPQWVRNFFNG